VVGFLRDGRSLGGELVGGISGGGWGAGVGEARRGTRGDRRGQGRFHGLLVDSRLGLDRSESVGELGQWVNQLGGSGFESREGSAVVDRLAGDLGGRRKEPGGWKIALGVKGGAEGDGGRRWPAGGLE